MSANEMDNAPRPAAQPAIASFPVSTTQQPFWFLDQVNPGDPSLNVAIRWELRGPVRATSVEAAFQTVVNRHEILRTRFVEWDGEPLQEVVADVDFKLGIVDLSTIDADDHAARIDTIAREDASKPFDLTQPCLLRATFVRLSAEQAILAIVAHHSCFDGFSIGILGHEIGLATEAIEAGRAPDLPELPLQYGDFSMWQREYHESGVLDEEAAYWTEQLKDMSYFEIEPDFPRPETRGSGVGSLFMDLPPAFGERMEAAARQHEVSTFALGAAVLSACLHRFTGKSEVIFGAQIAGRPEMDLEALIGVFINNVVLRFDTQSDAPFRAHLAHVKSVVQQALTHQNMPFNRLVGLVNPVRDPSRTPLISVNFNAQRTFLQNRRYGTFDLISVPSHTPGAVYDLNIFLIGRPEGWRMAVEYASDLFDQQTVENLLTLFHKSFEVALDTPNATLADIPVDAGREEKRDRETRLLRRVEDALAAHPQVDEAVAVPKADQAYAFVTAAEGTQQPLETLPETLTQFAASRLPVDDLPLGISILRDFPRSVDGAIRRDALQVPESVQSTPVEAPAVPADDVEARLRTIWETILGASDIPADKSFFDLGGHSLLAVRMLAQVREVFGAELGVAAIYQTPTLQGMAAAISSQMQPSVRDNDDWRILPIRKDGTGTPIIGINNVATVLSICDGFTEDRPAFCVRLFDGTRGLDQLDMSFPQIAAEYASVIREAQPKGPYLLYGVCVHGNLALEIGRHLKAAGEDVTVVMKDTWEPSYVHRILGGMRTRWADRRHSLKRRIKRYREGTMSLSALLGSYGIVRRTGILQIARMLRLIDRVKSTDLEPEQEGFIAYLTAARDTYKPMPYDGKVLHVVTGDTPQGRGFDRSIGWERVVGDDLQTVIIDEVLVYRDRKIGTREMAQAIEAAL